VAAAAVLAVGGATAILALHDAGGKPRDRADARYCGLVTCSVLRAAGHSDSHSGDAVAIGAPVSVQRPGRTSPPTPTPSATPAPTPAPPAPAASPAPRPTGSPPAPPGPAVTIAYSTPDVWDGGFQGEFTIVNHGSSTLENWQVVITLPGDQVDTAWNADWQPGPAGTVILTPASYDAPVQPGGTQLVNFVATGGTVDPASCTFDGSPCS
jgi:Cellulose binding domain